MSRHSWTAIVSAVSFTVLVALVALVPVPYVSWAPGRTVDLLGAGQSGQPAVTVNGIATHPVTGELRMTTVSVTRVDSTLTLPGALWAWLRPNHDALPRSVVYPPDKSVAQVKREEVAQMDTAQSAAIVAALREAKVPVTAMPVVDTVSITGPAYGKLQPSDLIERIDQTVVSSPDQVRTLISKHAVGDQVVFSVRRQNKLLDVTVTTVAANQDKAVPVVGIKTAKGYHYTPSVTYGISSDVVGPSAGLVFSLAIYDKVTPGDLMAGRHVAGTGTINADGVVGSIGGIQEKIAGAQEQGATVFLVPAANCVDLAGVQTTMNLLKVATLNDAVTSLTKLKDNPSATVPHC